MPLEALPIDAHLADACRLLAAHGALVLVAEPGAGKTTRLPPALVDAGVVGSDQVVVLEPRRVAARAAARRIAEERGDAVGGFAGYTVRFESKLSRATRVRVVTEGILTRALQSDPELRGVGAVVLDEFHERSLHADLALALLREVQSSVRPDLKLVVMSATLEVEPLAEFLGGAPVLRVPGRVHPLSIERIEEADQRPLEQRTAAAVRRALASGDGDILVFLPGVGEILRTQRELDGLARAQNILVLPLYGEQRWEEQERALSPAAQRKVILATNVAETSLTVPGVTCVVDTGLARVASHDPGRGLDRLELKRISRTSATQRAGRAGRLGPGRVLRMWSAAEETRMLEREAPEIRRVDLAGAVLELYLWGERDLARFRWFEAPDPAALERAEMLLVRLGALDPLTHAATPLGAAIARVPAHPRLARLLHAAWELGALDDGALLAALLSERDVLRRTRGAEVRLPTGPSDLLARRDLMLGRGIGANVEIDRGAVQSVERTAEQLARSAAQAFGRSPREIRADDEDLLRAIFAGFPDRVARRRERGSAEAVMLGGSGVVLAPESAVREEELFVVLDADLGRRGERASARVRQASAIERAWLEEIAGALRVERTARFDDVRERVVATKRTSYEDLTLEEVETGDPGTDDAKRLLLEAARRDPRRALALSENVQRWLDRVRSLALWRPELELPAHDDADLLAALEPWCDGKRSFADLRAIALLDVLSSRLTQRQRKALEEEAPEALHLPSGSTRRLAYQPGKPPVLAVRLQELFGQATTPTVAGGRVSVILHLLAPNQQIVQVTQDLASFWNSTYAQVRKDLRARYPKHSWPDDPWTAQPTSRRAR